jgi:hypothetical protein
LEGLLFIFLYLGSSTGLDRTRLEGSLAERVTLSAWLLPAEGFVLEAVHAKVPAAEAVPPVRVEEANDWL